MHSANIRQRCERVFIYTTDSFRRVESRGTRVRYTRRTSPSTAAPRYVSFLLRLSRFSTVLHHLANRSHSPPSNVETFFFMVEKDRRRERIFASETSTGVNTRTKFPLQLLLAVATEIPWPVLENNFCNRLVSLSGASIRLSFGGSPFFSTHRVLLVRQKPTEVTVKKLKIRLKMEDGDARSTLNRDSRRV